MGGLKPFRVVTPESPNEPAIVELVMSEIEQADLVVLDLTGSRPSVAYEAGIIHALGIPHIFVTEDEETSFYFSSVRVIRGLQIHADFNPADPSPSQGELFGRLKTFLGGADARSAMAGNILTAHFDGLPIVDLAGPAGMAASYYTNAVKRFIRPDGFAGRQCKFMFKEERPARFGSKTVTSTRSVAATVTALIAVEPPAQLSQNFFEDDRTLKAALRELGVELERATIAGDHPLDKRDYGGWFDASGIARGSTVCIEISYDCIPAYGIAQDFAAQKAAEQVRGRAAANHAGSGGARARKAARLLQAQSSVSHRYGTRGQQERILLCAAARFARRAAANGGALTPSVTSFDRSTSLRGPGPKSNPEPHTWRQFPDPHRGQAARDDA